MSLKLGTAKIYDVNVTDTDNRPLISLTEWTRPSEWIPMEFPSAGEQKFVGLYGVDSANKNNFVAFRFDVSGGQYVVDWGDGTVENYDSGVVAEHEYVFNDISSSTEYTTEEGFTYRQVVVTVTPTAGASITNVNLQHRHTAFTDNGHNTLYDVRWLELYINLPNAIGLGVGGTIVQLTYVKHLKIGELSPLLSYLGNLCSGMQALEKFEIEHDTSNVNSFIFMFYNCYEIEQIPDFDMSGGDSDGVDTYGMFYGCFRLVKLPSTLSGLRSRRTGRMFLFCRSLREIPWFGTTSLCTNMSETFYGCENIKAVPHIDTQYATGMKWFLRECYSLEKCPEFDTGNATDMSGFFLNCRSLTAVPRLNTSQNRSFTDFYQSCTNLKQVPQIDTSNGTIFQAIYSGCTQLESIPWFDTSKGINLSYLFTSCFSLKSVPLLDFSSARTIWRMFYRCYSLQDLPELDTAPILVNGAANDNIFNEVFRDCHSLKKIPDSFFNGAAAGRSWYYTFYNCRQLRSLPDNFGTNFNANNDVSNMQRMCENCNSLKYVPPLNVSTITSDANQLNAFRSCNSLESLVLNGNKWNTDITSNLLNRDSLVALFESLGTVSGKTLTYTGNPYNYPTALSPADKQIATDKGWTLNPA